MGPPDGPEPFQTLAHGVYYPNNNKINYDNIEFPKDIGAKLAQEKIKLKMNDVLNVENQKKYKIKICY